MTFERNRLLQERYLAKFCSHPIPIFILKGCSDAIFRAGLRNTSSEPFMDLFWNKIDDYPPFQMGLSELEIIFGLKAFLYPHIDMSICI